MSFPVPEDFHAALDALADLDADGWTRVKDAIEKQDPSLDVSVFVRPLEKALEGSAKHAKNVLTVFIRTYQEADRENLTYGEAADLLAKSYEGSAKWDEDRLELFKEGVEGVLRSEATLGWSAKALSVLLEGDNNYCTSRVITDVRPIFGRDMGVLGNVIVHHLRITAHRGNRPEDEQYFFSLDDDDVAHLIEVLQRAQQKAQHLREHNEGKFLGPEHD